MGGRALAGAVSVPETNNQTRPEPPADNTGNPPKASKRKKNRNRKRRNRHQSFIPLGHEESLDSAGLTLGSGGDSMEAGRPTSGDGPVFKLCRNLSNTSLESEALLDHRYVES